MTEDKYKGPWTIDHDNETGPGDDFYSCWWNVENGTVRFKCDSEEEAEWLAALLNMEHP